MVELVFDGSYEGFLTCIFEMYIQKINDCTVVEQDHHQSKIFGEAIIVSTNEQHAERIINGIKDKTSKKVLAFIYSVFLQESTQIHNDLVYFIKMIFDGKAYKISDFGDSRILRLHKAKKMMGREVHRMHAFVRFQQLKDDLYVAIVNPDFNVLPLIGKHFKDRYPTMEWLIYDTKRSYGIFHSEGKIDVVNFEEHIDLYQEKIRHENLSSDELSYQKMWQAYFQSVNIKERNNTKLHERHVPRRYWTYLVEKWN
ncbi:TIGR03915 family putative DNA repair protein [Portibacter lacus]|uniref:DNA metabolism protein n=1 Tax=Portibacter lacus TaxID=1099794 RepID=A0AA37WD81_9BACT|nr:TIGR03915 family putative DNA repair protein [Portibacter lacus]GLR16543.1 DNA metabolism protein [Portibacter lacus]